MIALHAVDASPRERLYRTYVGQWLKDDCGVWRQVVKIDRAEDIHRYVDGRCYRSRGRDERTVLTLPRANRTWKREP